MRPFFKTSALIIDQRKLKIEHTNFFFKVQFLKRLFIKQESPGFTFQSIFAYILLNIIQIQLSLDFTYYFLYPIRDLSFYVAYVFPPRACKYMRCHLCDVDIVHNNSAIHILTKLLGKHRKGVACSDVCH